MLPISFLAVVALSGSISSGECRPPKDSSEAKLLAFFAAPIAFSPSGHAERLAPGAVRLSFELTYVPTPSADIRRSSYCQRKSENTDLSPVFPRPRLAIGLPGGLYVEGSYLPPITVLDATPNLGSVALGWVHPLRALAGGGSTWLTLRGHATFGEVKGPITCSSDAIQSSNPSAVCYGDSPSDDAYKPNMIGGEGILGWTGAGRFAGYVGVGYTSIKPRLLVHFLSLNNVLDDTQVLLDDSRIAAFVGGRVRLSPRHRVHCRALLGAEGCHDPSHRRELDAARRALTLRGAATEGTIEFTVASRSWRCPALAPAPWRFVAIAWDARGRNGVPGPV